MEDSKLVRVAVDAMGGAGTITLTIIDLRSGERGAAGRMDV